MCFRIIWLDVGRRFLACSRWKSLLDIFHYRLMISVSRICYFRFCWCEQPYFLRWFECCVRECLKLGKIARWRRWWSPSLHWHWWDCSKRRLFCRGLPFNEALIILSWIFSMLLRDFFLQEPSVEFRRSHL